MRKFTAFLAASSSLVAMAPAAYAQDAAAGEAVEDEVADGIIIVEARRRGENLQDVPLSVQAVSSETLNNLEIRQFTDVTRAVPGLSLGVASTGISASSTLRGVNFDARASGASTTVEFYRNDVVISGGALFQSLYDVGQIEVLRGPQGTLRGRAAPSGSITLTTRRPDMNEVGGYVIASGTTKDARNINGAMNIPVVADKLAVRIAATVSESKGNHVTGLNVRTGATDDNIFDKTKGLRASVRVNPFDDIFLLDFGYETLEHKARSWDQVQSFNTVDSTRTASPVTINPSDRLGVTPAANSFTQKYQIFNWQAQVNLLEQKLTYVGGKLKGSVDALTPQDFAGLFPTAIPVASPASPYIQNTANKQSQLTHEVRLQNDERVAGLFDYVVGWMKVDAASPSFLNNITAFASPTTLFFVSNLGLNRYRADSESSFFGNATVHLFDRLELSGGVRKIRFKANSGVQTGTFGAPISTYVESLPSRRCFGQPAIPGCLPAKKATIYNASGKFKITDNAMVYATYGTSWRPGNSVIGFRGTAVGAFLNQFLNLPDETSKAIELGFKTSWLDDRLTFNVSAYKQKFDNYAFFNAPVIALNSDVGPAASATLASAFNFVSPVPVKVTGIETELNFKISDSFSIGSTAAYSKGTISNGIFPCLDLDNNNIPDTTVPTGPALFAHVGANQVDTCIADASSSSAPRWAGTVNAEYNMPISNSAEGFLRGFLSWKGKNDGFSLNPYDQVSSFGLFDLFAGVRDPDGAWEVTLFGKNVFNTQKVLNRGDSAVTSALRPGTNLAGFGGSGISINTSGASNYLSISQTAPREIGLTLRVAFGSR